MGFAGGFVVELTERQVQCLKMTATMTDKEIARELGISPHTVNMHIRNAMEKLGASSRGMALRTITGNPQYDNPVMARAVEIVGSEPVGNSPSQAELNTTVTSRISWLHYPAYAPAPPKNRLLRLLLILSLSFVILAGAASLVGLFKVVTDSLDGWAVDPQKSLREERYG